MLLVYCEHITPRVEYIFGFMLHTLCGIDFSFTTDADTYCKHDGPVLNYSRKPFTKNDVQIKPNGLLFLQTIISCDVQFVSEQETVQLFIQAPGVDASVFDLFAAAFFLLTRYEEYFPFTPDVYNRFEASASVQYKYQMLHRPLINEWAEALKQTFSKAHVALPFRKNVFACTITIDVDQAFAFRHRGIVKNALAFLKNLRHLNKAFLRHQLQTIVSSKLDPYDTFDYLKIMQQRTALPFIYFINAGSKTQYDKNLPVSNVHFKKLLNKIKTFASIGLHPSYFSDRDGEKTVVEKNALEAVLGQSVRQSRQHYLKLYFPHTYRRLLAAGITQDYTMSYASQPGFRAGTCTPFLWFDLEENRVTPLTVFPVTYMEGTFGEDLALSPEAALAEMKKLIDTVKLYNGHLIPIWHNHTVNDLFFWQGWKTVFEQSLHYIIKQ